MKNLKKLFSVYLILSIFGMLSSCGPSDRLVSLNSIIIPEYQDSDYVQLLDDENPEIVYNAICNLIGPARSFAEQLSVDTISPDLKWSKMAYDKISKRLLSDDEWVVCSSLRFFANFSDGFKNKDEIAQRLLKVNLKSRSIKLEYLNALQSLYGANPKPFIEKLSDFIKGDSWLVSRYTYSIVPYLNDKGLNAYLLANYSNSKEYDKLLVTNSLMENYNDTILKFVLEELKTEKSMKVKLALAKSLSKAGDQEKVMDWFKNNLSIVNEIKEPLAGYNISFMEKSSCSRMICFMLQQNIIPDSLIFGSNANFYERLNSCLHTDSLKTELVYKYFQEIESIIVNKPTYKENWIKYKLQNEEPVYSDEFVQKQKTLIEEFKAKSAKIYDQYQVDQYTKKKYLEQIGKLGNEFEKK